MATFIETINILKFEIIPRLSIRDQLHLCQTSKDLHTATVSVLYRDITITHDVGITDDPPPSPKSHKWLLELFSNSLSPQKNTFESRSLQNITHFEVANPRGWLGYEQLPRGIHLLSFYLPNARTLPLESFASHRKGTNSALADTNPFWPLSSAPQATFLTTLHLDHCSSNTHNITAMLAQTPNLKTLFYACYLPAFECDFDVDELRRGLEHVRNALTKLTLKLTIMQRGLVDFSDHEWPLTHGRIDDLRDFLSLTYLEIPLAFLHSHTAPENWQPLADLLPPNLTSFTVDDELMDHHAFSDLYTGTAIRDMMRTFLSRDYKS
ncbi:uncharacterized protein BKA55DRAFT_705652 [Fusarium redolens]|uniref:Uncharacterized protein n=1 Tax=Fusarium redolens TaxID=48865 RepID=A0A9P9GJY2_FUSRE|nr:uncharacterized protein BKA55DRAFT_705652 [Fusarium redolens]KAH7240850.1 hypothetical protein BKA55DRAFT_705652 [Fusarium redolens]